MKLELERGIDAPPSAVWPLLTEPRRLNRWSVAKVRLLDRGDGGLAWGVGALRRVFIPLASLRALAVDEVIEDADPARRFVYSALPSGPLRRHRGEIGLAGSEEDRSCRLTWTVDIDLAPLPAAGAALRRWLLPSLERSLDALQILARLERAAGPPLARSADRERATDDPSLPALRAEAGLCVARQRDLAAALLASGDPHGWFARAYQHVTELLVAACLEKRFVHPAWVLRVIPCFLAHYERNLRRQRREAQGAPDLHWRASFRAMRSARPWHAREVYGLCVGVARGAQAHIEEDLPRALGEVYVRHYRHRCDYVRFRGDYLRMAWVFPEARRRLWLDILERCFPLPVRFLEEVRRAACRLVPEEIDSLAARLFYDVPGQRLRAFDRGAWIADLLAPAGARPAEAA